MKLLIDDWRVRRLADARREMSLQFPGLGASPNFLARVSQTGDSFLHTSRAVPAGNNPASQRRIIKRTDNQRRVAVTGALKEADGAFPNCQPTVNHAGVTARGFRLVKVEPRDSKSSERRLFWRHSSNSNLSGLLFATANNLSGNQSINQGHMRFKLFSFFAFKTPFLG